MCTIECTHYNVSRFDFDDHLHCSATVDVMKMGEAEHTLDDTDSESQSKLYASEIEDERMSLIEGEGGEVRRQLEKLQIQAIYSMVEPMAIEKDGSMYQRMFLFLT